MNSGDLWFICIDKIKSGSFAEACYNDNTIAELENALEECDRCGADETDLDEWGLTQQEYKYSIKLALAALVEG